MNDYTIMPPNVLFDLFTRDAAIMKVAKSAQARSVKGTLGELSEVWRQVYFIFLKQTIHFGGTLTTIGFISFDHAIVSLDEKYWCVMFLLHDP